MGAGLDGEGAEGVGRVDLERGGLDAGLLRVGGVHHLDRVLVLLGPAQVHPQQHLGEVGGVDAAGAGADGDDGRPRVVLAVQQRLHLELAEQLLQALQLVAGFERGLVRRGAVGLVVHELDEHLEVVEATLDAVQLGELGLRVAQLARHLLRLGGVVPEVGHTGRFGERRDASTEVVHVDHGSDVGEGGAESGDLRREVEFGHGLPSLPPGPSGDPTGRSVGSRQA